MRKNSLLGHAYNGSFCSRNACLDFGIGSRARRNHESTGEENAMGHRLSKIATRTGDDGTTGLGDGSRVRKDDIRIAAVGDVDELNSQIGVLLCERLPDDVRGALTAIQHDLFDLGG